ncbi:MAG: sigma 54-interacting transcriptional regulator [Candidatus Poribacteria bacterium]
MGANYHFNKIIGASDAITEVFDLMEKAIDSDLDILITGETGTGKELVAKEIHYNSSRKEHPLLACNCSVGSKDVLLNQLFGHRKGAFPDAVEDKMGLFEAAEGSTFILDEIDETPLDVQPSLLRALKERKVRRLGETISHDVDVRVIAITERNLPELVEAGRFLFDLCVRLKTFEIHLPPLRERSEDIPLLIEHFYEEACRQFRREATGFTPDALGMLSRYSWPGNVRELRSVIRRACALAGEGKRIQTHHLPPQMLTEKS